MQLLVHVNTAQHGRSNTRVNTAHVAQTRVNTVQHDSAYFDVIRINLVQNGRVATVSTWVERVNMLQCARFAAC